MSAPEPTASPSAATTCSRCGVSISGTKLALDPAADALAPDADAVHGRGCVSCGILYCRSCLKQQVAWNVRNGHRESPCPKCGKRFGDGVAIADPAWNGGRKAAATAAPSDASAAPRRNLPRVLFPIGLTLLIPLVAIFAFKPWPWRIFGSSQGELTVESSPAGATVFVNGRLVGATPITISGLSEGAYALRLEREGFSPLIRQVAVGGGDETLREEMVKLPTGGLTVNAEPNGAEVLLNGVVVGNTPLVLTDVPIGDYELVVRKTNFESFTQRVLIKAHEVAEFEGFELRDLILAMLKRQCMAEPQRVAHRMDLGHYLFVNDEQLEAADAYGEALELVATPLEFPEEMPAEERALQQRLRSEDASRLNSELGKKRNWQGKDTTAFRERVDKIQAQLAEKHVESWEWVTLAAKNMTRAGKFGEAEDLFKRHLEAAPNSAHRSEAWLEILQIREKKRDLPGTLECATQIFADPKPNADLLRQAGNALYRARTSFAGEGRVQALDLANKLLRKAMEVQPNGELHALCAYELGNVLYQQREYAEALQLFRRSVQESGVESTREQRQVQEAECLSRLKQFAEARKIYEALIKSSQEAVRRSAEQGLKKLDVYEQKQ
ncbi:MAG: PEGA domain-containing protein [Planctomycetes bacterium]|nr:PEGA domain-containing protein [Planctomycetota bacterium]